MVKGINKQVIVVQSPEEKMFEQAIFILKEGVSQEITDETLLKEANRLMRSGRSGKKPQSLLRSVLWSLGGAAVTGTIWILSMIL